MNSITALKIFGAVASLSLAGCLSASQDEPSRADANSVKFVQESSAGLAKANATSNLPDISALGCPKLEKLFEDIETFQVSEDEPLPQSFKDYLSCFGISGNPDADDYDVVWEKLQNPTELLDCICGGSGLSNAFRTQQWTLFSASASAAAGSAFNAGASSAGGSTFNASQSNAGGSTFNANGSSAGGAEFSAD
jgi:hypothetical protein